MSPLKFSRRRILPASVLALALLSLLGAFGWPTTSSARRSGPPVLLGRSAAPAQELAQAADTLLYLPLNGSLTGADGETPTQSSGVTFESGVKGQGVVVEGSDVLRYATAGNFNAQEGTIELWVKPQWNGNSTSNSCFFGMGDAQYSDGSIVFEKDGSGNLGFTVNTPHEPVPVNVSDWVAGQWHYVAVTWKFPGQVKMYVDGVERYSRPSVAADIVSTVAQTMTVGSFNTSWQADAVIDEFRVSGVARTPEEIAQSFISDVTVNSLSMQLSLTEMYPTWLKTPTLTAQTNVGTLSVPPSSATWSSSDPAVATVDAAGQITAVAPGTVRITATVGGAQASATLTVKAPARAPEHEAVSQSLATPAANSLYEIPVVVVEYLPTANGTTLDFATAPTYDPTPPSLATMKQRISPDVLRTKFTLEEGSRFRGYKDPAARSSLGYRVVDYITIYEPTPQGQPSTTLTGIPIYRPDYHSIFQRLNAAHYVNDLSVKEFWIFDPILDSSLPFYNPALHRQEYFRESPESNMASPTTDDISNSRRDPDDLPIYSHTYTVYSQYIGRTGLGSGHIHGHQLESYFAYINQRQDGNTVLFWQKFVGRDTNFNWQRGRCGDTHHPPNALNDYDYQNMTPFDTDIEDWTPDRIGQTKPESAQTWGNLPYAWPGGATPATQSDRNEAQWYIYWMQNMPGLGNTIPNGAANRMTNWWTFVADWDAAVNAGLGLYQPAACAYALSATSQSFGVAGGAGSVSVTTDGVCARTATSNANWITINGGASGTGSGAINFTVAANGGAARTGTLTIAGQTLTVTQAGLSCVYTLSLTRRYVGSGGGSGTVDVTAAPVECAWSAASNDSWLTIVPVASGSGSGTVTYSAAANASGVTRAGTLTVAGQTVMVTQTATANPVDDTPFYVGQHYRDFLSREPDASGLAFWTNNIESCGTDTNCRAVKRVDTSAAFFLSIEFQQTGYLVYKMYKAAYGSLPNKPVAVRRTSWLSDTQSIGSGVVVGQTGWDTQLEQNKQAFALAFVQRSSFQSAHGTQNASTLVNSLFANAGVTPTMQEQQAAINAFNSAAATGSAAQQAAALRSVAESNSVSARLFDQAFVLMQYFGYLQRDPDAVPDSDFSGYNFWLTKLDQFNGNYVNAEMVKAFISSIEYRKRFGP